MVDQINLLTDTKRQVLLYSFMDWLNRETMNNVLLVGVTSDVKFAEKLEKRVKSRLSSE